MAKPDLAQALQSDLDNPGSLKSGEYLEEQVLGTIRRALDAGDRDGVVETLREWLIMRQEPQTMLAVTAAKEQHLTELVPQIEALRTDVAVGRTFQQFYVRWIDEALSAIRGSEH